MLSPAPARRLRARDDRGELRRTLPASAASTVFVESTLSYTRGKKALPRSAIYAFISSASTFSPLKQNSASYLTEFGAGNVTRTHDLLITNQLLYRLSYASTLTRLKSLAQAPGKVKRNRSDSRDYS